MAVISANERELKELLKEQKPAVVFYYRPPCPACAKLLSSFEEYSANYSSIAFVSVIAGENRILETLIEKEGKPFICLYKSELLLDCKIISDKNELLNAISRLLSEVRLSSS